MHVLIKALKVGNLQGVRVQTMCRSHSVVSTKLQQPACKRNQFWDTQRKNHKWNTTIPTYQYFAGRDGCKFLQSFLQVPAAIDSGQLMNSLSSHQYCYLTFKKLWSKGRKLEIKVFFLSSNQIINPAKLNASLL